MVDSGIRHPRYPPSAVRDFAHVFAHREIMQIQFKAHTNCYGFTFQWKKTGFLTPDNILPFGSYVHPAVLQTEMLS